MQRQAECVIQAFCVVQVLKCSDPSFLCPEVASEKDVSDFLIDQISGSLLFPAVRTWIFFGIADFDLELLLPGELRKPRERRWRKGVRWRRRESETTAAGRKRSRWRYRTLLLEIGRLISL